MTTIVLSLVLWAALRAIEEAASSRFIYGLSSLTLAMVPAWSMICAAAGAPLGRKFKHILVSSCLLVVLYLFAFFVGWFDVALGTTNVLNKGAALLTVAYRLIPIVLPITTLMLFADKRASVFWEPRSK